VYSKEDVDALVADMRHRYDQMRFRMRDMESGLCQMYSSELADAHIQIVKQRVDKANATLKCYAYKADIWKVRKNETKKAEEDANYAKLCDDNIEKFDKLHEKWLNVYNKLIKYYFSLSGRFYCDYIKPKMQNIERDTYLIALKIKDLEEDMGKLTQSLNLKGP